MSEKSTEKVSLKDLPQISVRFPESITFDFLPIIKERIDPSPYSWEQVQCQITAYPTNDPYLNASWGRPRTPDEAMGGSITVHLFRPDGRAAYAGITDRLDAKAGHHNFETWIEDFDGKRQTSNGQRKTLPERVHSRFSINRPIPVTMTLAGEEITNTFPAYKFPVKDNRTSE